MKASILRSLKIYFISVIAIANICLKSIIMQLLGKTSHQWANKVIQSWTKTILSSIEAKYIIVNPHHIEPKPGHPTIIMCNHSSVYDIPLSFCVFPKISLRMLGKKELFRIPIMGKGMIAAGFPSIDRKNKLQAIKDLEKIKDLLEEDIVVWIAPEGTRSKNGKLGTFKKGGFITAINAGATIIPIGIRGANKILPPKSLRPSIGETAEIHVGMPIDAKKYTLENKEKLIAEVYQSIKKLVGE